MNLAWLTRNKNNFLTFVETIAETKNRAIMQTTFVNSLFEQYWETYQMKIFWVQFVPYLLFIIFMLQYTIFELRDQEWIN